MKILDHLLIFLKSKSVWGVLLLLFFVPTLYIQLKFFNFQATIWDTDEKIQDAISEISNSPLYSYSDFDIELFRKIPSASEIQTTLRESQLLGYQQLNQDVVTKLSKEYQNKHYENILKIQQYSFDVRYFAHIENILTTGRVKTMYPNVKNEIYGLLFLQRFKDYYQLAGDDYRQEANFIMNLFSITLRNEVMSPLGIFVMISSLFVSISYYQFIKDRGLWFSTAPTTPLFKESKLMIAKILFIGLFVQMSVTCSFLFLLFRTQSNIFKLWRINFLTAFNQLTFGGYYVRLMIWLFLATFFISLLMRVLYCLFYSSKVMSLIMIGLYSFPFIVGLCKPSGIQFDKRNPFYYIDADFYLSNFRELYSSVNNSFLNTEVEQYLTMIFFILVVLTILIALIYKKGGLYEV